jgi:putative ABC transport system substrate-binding protein
MRRRDFINFLAGSTLVGPIAARAQQSTMPVIGFLNGASPDGYRPLVAAFREGLKKSGYVEGRNVTIEYQVRRRGKWRTLWRGATTRPGQP